MGVGGVIENGNGERGRGAIGTVLAVSVAARKDDELSEQRAYPRGRRSSVWSARFRDPRPNPRGPWVL